MMLRKDHRVNYVDDAVGGFDVHRYNLGTVDVHLVFFDFDGNRRSLHRRSFC